MPKEEINSIVKKNLQSKKGQKKKKKEGNRKQITDWTNKNFLKNKLVDLNPNISKITYIWNGLNISNKGESQFGWKSKTQIYTETSMKYKATNRLKSKGVRISTCKSMNFKPYFKPYTKFNLNWIID